MLLRTGLPDKRRWTEIALLAEEREEGGSSRVVDRHDQQAKTFLRFPNLELLFLSFKALIKAS